MRSGNAPKRAVGPCVVNVDIPAREKLIKLHFSDAKARRGDSPDPDMGKLRKGSGPIAMLHSRDGGRRHGHQRRSAQRGEQGARLRQRAAA